MSVVAPSMCLVPVEVKKKKVLDVLSYELSVMSGQSHSVGCRVELMSAARATSVCSH